jgi:hypothetical protein
MPLTPKQAEKVATHLAGQIRACQMCGNPNWEPLDVITAPIYIPEPQEIPGQTLKGYLTAQYAHREAIEKAQAIPFLVLGCTRCFHTVLYAWRPIEEGRTKGG